MSSEFGKNLRVSLFGESHGTAVGAVIQGLPAGCPIDLAQSVAFLSRRRPGIFCGSTTRCEKDTPVLLSGLMNGKTTGAPLAVMLENIDSHSRDYSQEMTVPRPSHADYTQWAQSNGCADCRGGGHHSGRLTAPLCFAGSVALQILAHRDISIGAHLCAVGAIRDDLYTLNPEKALFDAISGAPFPVLNETAGQQMQSLIADTARRGDSIGGQIECAAIGVPAGWGSPLFDGVQSRLSAAMFGIPSVKGIEFGSGFAGSEHFGSENNDPFCLTNGKVATATNHSGGIQGGITNGMPILFRLAIKPTASIALEQQSVDLSTMTAAKVQLSGRHDTCIAVRAVPVVEAVTALVLLDLMLEEGFYGIE